MAMADETIFALSSGAGRAGVAVVRLSGPQAGRALAALSGRGLPVPRQARLDLIRDPATGDEIDQALTLWFPGPGSFTGEDCAEIQGHGGPASVAALLDSLGRQPGLRLAEPGEFTKRAVLNGKMDLTQAEGLLDLIQAETDGQRRQALAQTEGALGRLIEGWRDRLVRLLAHGEAEIDFPDEGDAPDEALGVMGAALTALREEIDRHLADKRRGERLREGHAVALLGAPNAGKSTLLNALARRDVAIVSAEPGTTRDVLEVPLDLGGLPVRIADTAGLRETDQAVEQEGIRRARARAETADRRVLLVDLSAADPLATQTLAFHQPGDYVLLNKIDQVSAASREGVVQTLARMEPRPKRVFAISARDGVGLDRFLEGLSQDLTADLPNLEAAPMTRLRHRRALEESRDHLCRAESHLAGGALAPEILAPEILAPELLAEDLRLALRSLGRITGRVDVEDLLDVVFRDFCIGK